MANMSKVTPLWGEGAMPSPTHPCPTTAALLLLMSCSYKTGISKTPPVPQTHTLRSLCMTQFWWRYERPLSNCHIKLFTT